MFKAFLNFFQPNQPKRQCKNCHSAYQHLGILRCGDARVHLPPLVEPDDFCPLFKPYTIPTEEEAVKRYLERCLEK